MVHVTVMRNTTIWESASRPLFVRTVWLEGSELRRGLQRHFLWNYDTSSSSPLERLNSINNNLPVQKATELNDFKDFDDFNGDNEEAFLVGSAKVQLHDPSKLILNKKVSKHRRRSLTYNPKRLNCDNYHLDYRSGSDISEIHAIKSSLSSTPKLADTAEELLAERVLHWLDLAGKEEFLKNLNELKGMEVKLSKTCRLRQDAIKRYHNKIPNTQKSKISKSKKFQSAAAAVAPAAKSVTQRNKKSTEPVKHVTIIFNKEGQPVHLNPSQAKNIELVALTSSPSATRRLVGSLGSNRLHKSAENSRGLNNSKALNKKANKQNMSSKLMSASRRLDTVADLAKCTFQRRLHESYSAGGHNNLDDAKKQLHIFMPTLPKKGLNSSAYGTEDGISELSHNFNEMCRI